MQPGMRIYHAAQLLQAEIDGILLLAMRKGVPLNLKAATLAKWESKINSLITKLPPKTVVAKYSAGRLDFLEKFKHEECKPHVPPKELEKILWGLCFRSPIMNAAGMFKNGDCYELKANQGAGGYQSGTTTANDRRGNEKEGIYLPFVPYRGSHAASNWLELPNDGHGAVAKKLAFQKRTEGCPIVHSVMESPDAKTRYDKLAGLIDGMNQFGDVADVLVMNKSCPNTGEGKPDYGLVYEDLRAVRDRFLERREGIFPKVMIKWSNDTKVEDVPRVMDMMFELGFDGVEFGNTSTDYKTLRNSIVERERKLYDYFTTTFGGGVSGAPLKQRSLLLCAAAMQYLRAGSPKQEFHVWRTGGIQWADDIKESDKIGVSMNLWFTGYFEKFAEHGHDVYKELYKELI